MTFDGYVLCATPRSGSTLLCDLLIATGIAGHPESFYRRESIAAWAAEHGEPSDEGEAFDWIYLEAVRAEGSNGTGCFGLRLMWSSLPDLSTRLEPLFPGAASDPARLEAAFGRLRYVYLWRGDAVAQAVSRLKAEQTGLWHRYADGRDRERIKPPEPAIYDFARLAAFVAESETANAEWDHWFTQQAIVPHRIVYENLSADPRGTLAALLSALGKDPAPAQSVAVRSGKLSDAESAAWAARFREEQGPV